LLRSFCYHIRCPDVVPLILFSFWLRYCALFPHTFWIYIAVSAVRILFIPSTTGSGWRCPFGSPPPTCHHRGYLRSRFVTAHYCALRGCVCGCTFTAFLPFPSGSLILLFYYTVAHCTFTRVTLVCWFTHLRIPVIASSTVLPRLPFVATHALVLPGCSTTLRAVYRAPRVALPPPPNSTPAGHRHRLVHIRLVYCCVCFVAHHCYRFTRLVTHCVCFLVYSCSGFIVLAFCTVLPVARLLVRLPRYALVLVAASHFCSSTGSRTPSFYYAPARICHTRWVTLRLDYTRFILFGYGRSLRWFPFPGYVWFTVVPCRCYLRCVYILVLPVAGSHCTFLLPFIATLHSSFAFTYAFLYGYVGSFWLPLRFTTCAGCARCLPAGSGFWVLGCYHHLRCWIHTTWIVAVPAGAPSSHFTFTILYQVWFAFAHLGLRSRFVLAHFRFFYHYLVARLLGCCTGLRILHCGHLHTLRFTFHTTYRRLHGLRTILRVCTFWLDVLVLLLVRLFAKAYHAHAYVCRTPVVPRSTHTTTYCLFTAVTVPTALFTPFHTLYAFVVVFGCWFTGCLRLRAFVRLRSTRLPAFTARLFWTHITRFFISTFTCHLPHLFCLRFTFSTRTLRFHRSAFGSACCGFGLPWVHPHRPHHHPLAPYPAAFWFSLHFVGYLRRFQLRCPVPHHYFGLFTPVVVGLVVYTFGWLRCHRRCGSSVATLRTGCVCCVLQFWFCYPTLILLPTAAVAFTRFTHAGYTVRVFIPHAFTFVPSSAVPAYWVHVYLPCCGCSYVPPPPAYFALRADLPFCRGILRYRAFSSTVLPFWYRTTRVYALHQHAFCRLHGWLVTLFICCWLHGTQFPVGYCPVTFVAGFIYVLPTPPPPHGYLPTVVVIGYLPVSCWIVTVRYAFLRLRLVCSLRYFWFGCAWFTTWLLRCARTHAPHAIVTHTRVRRATPTRFCRTPGYVRYLPHTAWLYAFAVAVLSPPPTTVTFSYRFWIVGFSGLRTLLRVSPFAGCHTHVTHTLPHTQFPCRTRPDVCRWFHHGYYLSPRIFRAVRGTAHRLHFARFVHLYHTVYLHRYAPLTEPLLPFPVVPDTVTLPLRGYLLFSSFAVVVRCGYTHTCTRGTHFFTHPFTHIRLVSWFVGWFRFVAAAVRFNTVYSLLPVHGLFVYCARDHTTAPPRTRILITLLTSPRHVYLHVHVQLRLPGCTVEGVYSIVGHFDSVLRSRIAVHGSPTVG